MKVKPDVGLSPGKIAWRRFRKNYLAFLGLGFLFLCTFLAIFSYFIIPDNTRNANFQVMEWTRNPPGFSGTLLLRPQPNQMEENQSFFSFLLQGKSDVYEPIPIQSPTSFSFLKDSISYSTMDGSFEKLSLASFFYSNPFYDEKNFQNENLFRQKFLLSRTYYFGTDNYGRDVLSRLILGIRISLSVGFLAVALSLILGISLGAAAGFFGGWTDTLIMWFTSVIWSIPALLLAISLTFILEKGFTQVFVAIGFSMWVEVARMVRGQILSVRELQYVEAAKALGFNSFRTIAKHVLPNVINPVIIIAAANFASAILLEAGLSFLGVGVQSPVPSWGGMIRDGYTYIIFDSGKWLALFPGMAIVFMVISLNLVGYGLRDALDPKRGMR